MVLSDFLSRQRNGNSNQHEIIPILFNIQSILHSKYYNIGEGKVGKYLVQTGLQAKFSDISLLEVHGIGKGFDPNMLPEKWVLKPIATSKVKGTCQIKPRLGQDRVGWRQKIKTQMPPSINKAIVKITKKPV